MTRTKVAVACAATTTLLAMAASGLVFATGGTNYAEGIHQLAMIVMLVAYLFLIVSITSAKKMQCPTLNVVEENDSLIVSPCGSEDYWIFDQEGIDKSSRNPNHTRPRNRRHEIRVVVARDVSIPDTFLEALALFPNLAMLDIQNAKVEPSFWDSLEVLPNLTDVLATNALPDDLQRNMSYALPEVKFWTGKQRKLALVAYQFQKSGRA